MILEGLTSALALQVGNLFHPPVAAPLAPLAPSPLETIRDGAGSKPIDDVMKKTTSNGIYVHGSARNILPVGTFTRDVVVVGGGLAGLSTALELSRRGVRVTVLSDNLARSASAAAGGMIAPQAEMLPEGPYLDLCLRSRSMYYPWVQMVETMSSTISPSKVDVGLQSNRGFIAPAFEGDAVHRWSPPKYAGQIKWLDNQQLREMEPLVSENVIGGWWYPQDMSVDAQTLLKALHGAVIASGGEILEGVGAKRFMYGMYGDHIESIALSDGRHINPGAVVVATGAWMGELVPIKMEPIKGQVMSLKLPKSSKKGVNLSSSGHPLYSVLFADGAYLIPKRDGSIVVGGTTERGVWDNDNTPRGISHVTSVMSKVCPSLYDFTVERIWAGLRPTPEDYLPVLGATEKCENLFMCGGFWRNGVLLPPKAAQLVADAVVGVKFGKEDARFMEEFSPDRFDGPCGTTSTSHLHVAFSSSSSSSSSAAQEKAALISSSTGPTISSLPSSCLTSTENDLSSVVDKTFTKLVIPEVKMNSSGAKEEEIQKQRQVESSSLGNTTIGAAQPKGEPRAATISVESQVSSSKEEPQGGSESSSPPPARFTDEELQMARELNRDMNSISEDFECVLDSNIEEGDRAPSWSPEAPSVAKRFGAKLVSDPRGSWHPPSSEDEIFAMVVDESTGEEVFPSTSSCANAFETSTAAASTQHPETPPFTMFVSNTSLGIAAAATGVRGVQPQRSAEVEALYESILKTKSQASSVLPPVQPSQMLSESELLPLHVSSINSSNSGGKIGWLGQASANRKVHKKDSPSPFSWLTGLLRMKPSITTTTTFNGQEDEEEEKEMVSNKLYGYDRVKERLQNPIEQDLNEAEARRANVEDDIEEDENRFEEIAKEFGEI